MELWGSRLFGAPCRECGFDWSTSVEESLAWVMAAREIFDAATVGAIGTEHGAGWSVSEYTSHVADNLRQWAERVQGARLANLAYVAGYDPDGLAVARRYSSLPLAAAIWSLGLSAESWVAVMEVALHEGVVLQHAARGRQRAEDIIRNNTHDAHHHLWDIRQILDAN